MSRDFSGFRTKAGEHWRDDLHKYKAVIEQRAIFYGKGAAKEAAEAVLEAAKENCPVDTGHLKNSGRVLFVGAGATEDGVAEGVGQATGSYYKNSSKKAAYVVSFNTMRVAKEDGVTSTDAHRVEGGKSVAAMQKRGSKSLDKGFNYAIKIHEMGGKGGKGEKFLENAYREKKEEIVKIFKKVNADIWMRSSGFQKEED